ncbi:ComEA family DNA-binding protein [Aeromicrobium fastidiosum]|uniref:ComEA family DNA-binding protein n=1 Tax=Aeromicrobium fastidiosum TaxID=52699 RepID=A0A641AQ99_9ACTN|nr:ComEA family DNA-binding protein [Aeromicrobium fastidiosum]KAA1378425.1 ComEA family DNA-binding protein [Aeromicrobium fastidiosum]MBP2392612.1 competence protein ComEA [Aeromicrobium fastidiosum]
MKPLHRDDPLDETRADIARRRLAQLAASFDAELPPAEEPEAPQRRRVEIPHARALATIAVAASVLLVWWLLAGRPDSSPPVAPLSLSSAGTGSPAVQGQAAAQAQPLIIDVVGDVKKPGIVTLPKGSRVYEAIEAAGGLDGRVDTTALNMARELTDGEQVLVGIDPVDPGVAGAPGSPGTTGAAPAGTKVNLNTATAEQLDALPGVGPVTAQAILAWRDTNGRFGSVDDLLDVKGIGDATLAELRDLVVV